MIHLSGPAGRRVRSSDPPLELLALGSSGRGGEGEDGFGVKNRGSKP